MRDYTGPNRPLRAISIQKDINVGPRAASRNNIQIGTLTSIAALLFDLKKNIYKNSTQIDEAIEP